MDLSIVGELTDSLDVAGEENGLKSVISCVWKGCSDHSCIGNFVNNHRISGYSVGADDYIAKPFNPDLLVARVKAVPT